MTDQLRIDEAVAQLLDVLDESDTDRPAREALLAVQDALRTGDTIDVAGALVRLIPVLAEHPFVDPTDLAL